MTYVPWKRYNDQNIIIIRPVARRLLSGSNSTIEVVVSVVKHVKCVYRVIGDNNSGNNNKVMLKHCVFFLTPPGTFRPVVDVVISF